MNKKWVLVTPFAALVLTACGQSGQQPANSTTSAPASAEITTPVPAGSVQPVPAGDVTSAALSGQACSLDAVDGDYAERVSLDKGKPHVFRGWLENNQQKPAGKFRIVMVGAQDFAVPAETGVSRPDVATTLKNPALEDSGFNASVDLGSMPSGDYSVRFLMQTDGKMYWCDAKKNVVLK
ncbi:MAG TPA: hypothetical protein VJL61_07570 [Rhodanobacteraceae bacterium]|nr:hypothetical protein [Rhodanobacteraceae bacterium]